MTNVKPHTVLIAVASRHGSTAEIAGRIGRRLREELPAPTWHVQVEDADAIDTIEGYDAVVLGSAVYVGRWLKSARTLLRNAEVAPPAGLWLFSSGPTSDDPPKDVPAAASVRAAERLGARDLVSFSGRIEVGSLGPAERLLTNAMRVAGGDFRDWDAVDAWARGIARVLSNTALEDRPSGAAQQS
ncbi:MAG: flavodoxin domain-containing protein [Actinomycetota bacterium]|nr:flavodoxin domain-containing protein [Actinomycetota bacterium]